MIGCSEAGSSSPASLDSKCTSRLIFSKRKCRRRYQNMINMNGAAYTATRLNFIYQVEIHAIEGD